MVHLSEKLFTDASLANMYILCMNILIALTTVATIILIDLLGESDVSYMISSHIEESTDFINVSFLTFCSGVIKYEHF